MKLQAFQRAFREEIIADDENIAKSSPGMAIYRDAYRGRLLATLETSFERTRRLAGEASFTAAACHYVLSRPPTSWTLDDYGAEFPDLLATLFGGDPEVAELAWLEWKMSHAFAAPERPTLDPSALATSCPTEADWDRVSFTMAAGFAMRPIATNCSALWEAQVEAEPDPLVASIEPGWLLVWRSGFSPSFRTATNDEADALGILVRGGSLGDLASTRGADRLGAMLAQWFSEGIFATALT